MRDLYRPGGGQARLTRRLALSLIDQLPGESMYKTAVRDALTDDELAALGKQNTDRGHGTWSQTDLLLAHVIDLLNWVVYAVVASAGGKPDKPNRYPRPGVARTDSDGMKAVLSVDERSYLERIHLRRDDTA